MGTPLLTTYSGLIFLTLPTTGAMSHEEKGKEVKIDGVPMSRGLIFARGDITSEKTFNPDRNLWLHFSLFANHRFHGS
jgi:hypothetical protein